MNNRKTKLEKALTFEYIHSMGSNDYERGLNDGVELENVRLAPLHEALVAAVEALEYLEDDSQYGEYVKKALAKLDQILKGDQNEKSYT